MKLLPGHIPPHVARLLPASDPASAHYRPPAPVVTDAERATAARVEMKAERDLQAAIFAYLRHHRAAGTVRGIINPRMDQRSHLPVGWPDFTFCYRSPRTPADQPLGRPVALEVKMPGLHAEPHQAECHDDLRKDGWFVWVVHSIEEVSAALDALDYAAETGR